MAGRRTAQGKPTSNLRVGMSGDVTTRASITWLPEPVRLTPNLGPMVLGASPPAGRATLERLHRVADLNSRRVEDSLQQQREPMR